MAFIESSKLSSKHSVQRRFVVVGEGSSHEPLIRQETLSQGWGHQSAPKRAPEEIADDPTFTGSSVALPVLTW